MFLRAMSAMTLALFSVRLLDGDAGGGGGLLVGEVLRGLALAIVGGFEGDIVLAGGDGGDGGIAADLEFGEFDVGLGAEHGVLGFLVGGGGIGFGLDDLLLGFGEIGFGFLELEFLLGGIELDDDVAGLRRVRRVRGGR